MFLSVKCLKIEVYDGFYNVCRVNVVQYNVVKYFKIWKKNRKKCVEIYLKKK